MMTDRLDAGCRRWFRGITLVECLVYISSLAVVTGLAFGVFYRAMDFWRDMRRFGDQTIRALQCGERWRADVRAATGPIELERKDGGQILRVPQGSESVVYVFSDRQVARWGGGGLKRSWQMDGVQESRWMADRRNQVAAWRWELVLEPGRQRSRRTPSFTFLAVEPAGRQP